MKRLVILFLVNLCLVILNFAQAPQAIKYQAIARDNSGNVLSSSNVVFRISILQNSVSGATVYEETQIVTTNAFGLAGFDIGYGAGISGNFSKIDWSTGIYFVKIELSINGSSIYTLMGTSQLMSVPYALYSEKSGPKGVTGMTLRHDGTTWAADSFLYNAGNAIGIGTTKPLANLHLLATSPEFMIEGNAPSYGFAGIALRTNNNSGNNLWVGKYDNTWGSINLFDNVHLGNLSILANDQNAGGLLVTTMSNDPLYFGTNNHERMRIRGDGNVGIGDQYPDLKLSVDLGNRTKDDGIKIKTADTQYNTLFKMEFDSVNHKYHVVYDYGKTHDLGIQSWNELVFFTNVNDYNYGNMLLNSTGLGIGTQYPTQKLHVEGNIYAYAPLGVILNQANSPLITRGGDLFASGTYKGIGRWGLYMEPDNLTFGVPAIVGKGFQFVNYNDNSTVANQLVTINQTGDVDIRGKVTRTDSIGTANLLPVAYGTVADYGDGPVIYHGSGNFTVIFTGSFYEITINNFSNQQVVQCTSIVTPWYNAVNVHSVQTFVDANYKIAVILIDKNDAHMRGSFNFTVYKP